MPPAREAAQEQYSPGLLDAVREQRARDRVRAAIERLTGAPRADATPAADEAPAAADKAQ